MVNLLGMFMLMLMPIIIIIWFFAQELFPLILLAALPSAARILWSYLQYRNSSYGKASGIGYWKTFLNKGTYGEFLIYRVLEGLPGEKRLFANVYVPRDDNTTTEVDVIMINEAGIFVFESKNFSGWIYGDERKKLWTQALRRGFKNSFYNPIWQNRGHITALQNALPDIEEGLFHSYIVFSQRCTLKSINVSSPGVRVLKRTNLERALYDDMTRLGVRLDFEEIEIVSAILGQYSHADEHIKGQHVESIKRRYESTEQKPMEPAIHKLQVVAPVITRVAEVEPLPVAMPNVAVTVEETMCQLCSGKLEWFTGRRGQYQGCTGCDYRSPAVGSK